MTSANSLRVAVLEDDAELRDDILVPQLADFGFSTEGFATPTALHRRLLAIPFELLVLDIGLVDGNGLDVARTLRATSAIGIVALTGRANRRDRVRGLTEAIDGWLVKPVEIEVLAATLHSLGRRMRMGTDDDHAAGPAPAAAWYLSSTGWHLHGPNARVPLNLLERRLLVRLLANRDELVGRGELISMFATAVEGFDAHRLEMLIHRLRRKVMEHAGTSLPLRAMRGQGYVMFAGDETARDGN